ncbi:MAG: hypothetical protein GYA43_04905 [Bacteroidales bacterium]|nr:hypothetical protein [Bacteroidales bacterium]
MYLCPMESFSYAAGNGGYVSCLSASAIHSRSHASFGLSEEGKNLYINTLTAKPARKVRKKHCKPMATPISYFYLV